jgi:hypothetical protein
MTSGKSEYYDIPRSIIEAWKHGTDMTLIDGGKVYTGTITAEKIFAESITTAKLAVGSVTPLKLSILGTTIWLPPIWRVSPTYLNGAFWEFNQVYFVAGAGADGTNYLWYRAYVKFNLYPLYGRTISVAELRWLLASKAFAGSGPNAQNPLRLHAIADFGMPDKTDWGLATQVDYGTVNTYTSETGLAYIQDVKARIEALIAAGEAYAAFRFVTRGEGYSSDLAVGGTATASTEFSASYIAPYAFDDNQATSWSSAATAGVGWLRYQLSAA